MAVTKEEIRKELQELGIEPRRNLSDSPSNSEDSLDYLVEEVWYLKRIFKHYGKAVKLYPSIAKLRKETNYTPSGFDFEDVYFDGDTLHIVPGLELGSGWHEMGHIVAACPDALRSPNWTPERVLAANGELVGSDSPLYRHTLNIMEDMATQMQYILMKTLCTHKNYMMKSLEYVSVFDAADVENFNSQLELTDCYYKEKNGVLASQVSDLAAQFASEI